MKPFFWTGATMTGLVLAFGAPAAGGGCSGESCDDAGCGSGVGVSFVNQVAPAPGAARVRVCVEGGCGRSSLGPQPVSAGVRVDDPSERDVRVELTVVDRNGRTLARDRRTVALEKHQPNGSGCEPTCYSASLSYDVRNLEWNEPEEPTT